MPSLPRFRSVFRKEMLETFRDWKMLSLVLTFAPFFVLLMYGYLGHSTPVFQIAAVNQDVGALTEAGETERLGNDLVELLRGVQSPEGDTVLRVRLVSEEELEPLLESRRADLAVVVPRGFSEAIVGAREGRNPLPVPIRSRGDPARSAPEPGRSKWSRDRA